MKMNKKNLWLCIALVSLLILCLAACNGSNTPTETTPETQTTEVTEMPTEPITSTSETEAETPAETETETEVETDRGDALRTSDNRRMDMIVWYDIDHGKDGNDRPDNGWYYLYNETPGIITVSGHHRAANPLLGTYNQKDITTARQHLYWLMAAGVNGITCDWTNYQSRFDENTDPNTIKYRTGVYNNTEVLLQAVAELQASGVEEVPLVYATIRLNGLDFDMLERVLDEVYSLYEKYPDQIYHFNGSDKPFVVIFAEKDYMRRADRTVKDDRFDIRWSNGHMEGMAKDDEAGNGYLTADRHGWLFVENVKGAEEGTYKSFYTVGEDGLPEMMTAWTAVWLGWSNDGSGWDGQNTFYNGLSAFERTTVDVETYDPKALLVCRFNYALCWKEQPQEGLGLYQSVHFEPCEELGFSLFNHVTERLYDFNDWIGEAPAAPAVASKEGNVIRLDRTGYPLEYRVGATETLADDAWDWINVNTGIDLSAYAEQGYVYIQTRNAFGESETVRIELS